VRLLVALVAAAVLAGCGGPPAAEVLGKGPQRVTIFRPDEPRGATVLFLHGWGGMDPDGYRGWIDHLVDRGHVVVFPRYQDSFASLPAKALPDALAGIRTAFAELEPDRVVAVGHSAGGALAADYAAVAEAARLPVPDAIMLAYPGRQARRLPGRLPELGDHRIPRSVRILTLASPTDVVVGTRTARAVVRDAGHGRFILVREPGVEDHLAPMRSGPAERRVFWSRLDRLLRE
jgi:acetyl esterase/lipase